MIQNLSSHLFVGTNTKILGLVFFCYIQTRNQNREKTLLKKKKNFLSRQVDFFLKKLISRLNFRIQYYFLLVVKLHTYINLNFNLI